MINKYRVDWQSGMRLTDETFRASDNYFLACMQPLYAALVNGDYGFTELPIFRYEVTETSLSVVELQAQAISQSGKLISLSFTREERTIFQNINFPDTTEPLILYIDKSSDELVKITGQQAAVPLCDADYKLIFMPEYEHYNNPDAVPLARFIYKYGWSLDASFIAPCINLRANGTLLRAAANYVIEVQSLIKALVEASGSQQYVLVMSVLPALSRICVEIQKEADAMCPRHLITLMQEVVHVLLTVSAVDEDIQVPELERCMAFVESFYTPFIISEMVNEGLFLAHALIGLPLSFREKPAPAPTPVTEPEVERVRPQRRVIGSTDSIRKRHH